MSRLQSPLPSRGKLILFVADPPSALDLEAQHEIQNFDPTVQVATDSDETHSRPRLDALLYKGSIFRGNESIRGFVEMERWLIERNKRKVP